METNPINFDGPVLTNSAIPNGIDRKGLTIIIKSYSVPSLVAYVMALILFGLMLVTIHEYEALFYVYVCVWLFVFGTCLVYIFGTGSYPSQTQQSNRIHPLLEIIESQPVWSTVTDPFSRNNTIAEEEWRIISHKDLPPNYDDATLNNSETYHHPPSYEAVITHHVNPSTTSLKIEKY